MLNHKYIVSLEEYINLPNIMYMILLNLQKAHI